MVSIKWRFLLLAAATIPSVLAQFKNGPFGVDEDSCALREAPVYSKVSFSYKVTPTTITFEMVSEGSGWLAIGLAKNPGAGSSFAKLFLDDVSLAIVGIPGRGGGIQKYRQNSSASRSAALVPGGADTLVDASLTQKNEGGRTFQVLKFTKLLEEAGDPVINVDDGVLERFVWAYGFSPRFPAFHRRKSFVQLDLSPCIPDTSDQSAGSPCVEIPRNGAPLPEGVTKDQLCEGRYGLVRGGPFSQLSEEDRKKLVLKARGDGKRFEFPECVGLTVEECLELIKAAAPDCAGRIKPATPRRFNFYRIWIKCDESGNVVGVPRRG